MPNWIEYPATPTKLYLAWQAPDHVGNRFRWAVGVVEPALRDSGLALRYFVGSREFSELNNGASFDDLLKLGYQGYPGLSLRHIVHEHGVTSALMRRLPPLARPDFRNYIETFRVASTASVTELQLLGLTEAKLPSDGFSLVDPLDPAVNKCDLMLELAGYRHYAKDLAGRIYEGAPVTLLHEPDNPKDPGAVLARLGSDDAGYINRLQAETFRTWLKTHSVNAVVERLNGSADRPRAYIFVSIRRWAASEAA